MIKVVSEEGILRVKAGDWRIKLGFDDNSVPFVSEIVRRPKAYKK